MNSCYVDEESPIERLLKLNQFVESTLNPEDYKGEEIIGAHNILNGCFVKQVYSGKKVGLFGSKTELTPINEMVLIWQAGGYDNNGRVVKLNGDALKKYMHVMQLQSLQLAGTNNEL